MDFDRREMLIGGGGLALMAAGSTGANARSAASDAVTGAGTEPMWFGGSEPSIPRAGLRWCFSVAVLFAQRTMVQSPTPRGFTWAAGGPIWGPRLQGRVLPYSGADYYRNGFYTHYMLEAADGALIHIHNRGTSRRFKAPFEAGMPLEPVQRDEPAGWTRFRVSPVFEAPSGPHEWMNQTLIVGSATIFREPIDHTEFHYFEVL